VASGCGAGRACKTLRGGPFTRPSGPDPLGEMLVAQTGRDAGRGEFAQLCQMSRALMTP
jgi:hypothetical protein